MQVRAAIVIAATAIGLIGIERIGADDKAIGEFLNQVLPVRLQSPEPPQRVREKDLPRHMENQKPDSGASKQEAFQAETHKMIEQDNQLRRALDVLKSYKIMAQMNFK